MLHEIDVEEDEQYNVSSFIDDENMFENRVATHSSGAPYFYQNIHATSDEMIPIANK